MARRSSKDVRKQKGVRRRLTKKNDLSRSWAKKMLSELNANKED
ncbi:hypothetical protein [Priestia megaterium]|nr:hypothetical protein [Priestia megaterium]